MSGSKLLPELFAGLLQDAIGRFLRSDPKSPQYLAALAGKVIALRLTPPGFTLYLCPDEGSMAVFPSYGGEPDVLLRGSPLAFARMGLSPSPKRALFAGEVRVEGDMAAARRFQSLFERLDIDWEGLLARYAGQGLASSLAGALRTTHAWSLETLEAWRMNLAEYLQEESRELPAFAEAEIFFTDVDVLRADFDRLEARILRLESRLAEATPKESSP